MLYWKLNLWSDIEHPEESCDVESNLGKGMYWNRMNMYVQNLGGLFGQASIVSCRYR